MRVIALGFFDGVHIGHGALLRRTRERATELGLRAAAMSFDSHPDTLVSGVPVPLINSMDDRAALMRRLYGIDDVIFAHFDRARIFSATSSCASTGRRISSAGMISGSAIADRARRSGCGNTARRMDWAAT